MRILLTGSSGWLGRYLAPLLAENGHDVTGMDVVPGAHTQVVGTVADRALVDRTMGAHGIQAVIHGGALHKPDIVRYPRQAFEAGAWWMDEDFGPLAPRNIYGITKLAAEQACRLVHREHGINVAILRTGRFFPEDDDTHATPSGPNLKANELLHRRLTVEDAAAAHLAALEAAPALGCDTFILSAPPPFAREEAEELARDARAVIARHHPDAADLYAAKGWVLPEVIDRVYDPSHAERRFGWRARSDFASVLAALRDRTALPFAHDPAYTSPIVRQEREACTS